MSNVKIKSYSQPRQENLKDKNIQSIPLMSQKPLFRGESFRNQERPSYNQQVYIVDNKENNSYKYLHSQAQQNNSQQLRQIRPSSSNIRNEKQQDQQYKSRPHSNSHDRRDKKDQYPSPVTQIGPQIQQFHINSAPFLNLKKLLTDNRGSSMKEDSNLKNSLVIPPPSTQSINPQVTQVKPITTYQQNSQQKSDRYFSNNEQSYQIQQHSNQKQYYQSSQQQYQQNRSQNSQQQQSQQQQQQKIFPQQQQQQQQQFYQQQNQQKQQILLQQQQKLQQYQSQQIQTLDVKNDDKKFYQSATNDIRLKQQIQRPELANTSQTQNKPQDISQSQTDTCLLENQQGYQNSTKRSQEFQEYQKLQDKLQYLENKIISIKSNIDCSIPHLSKNSNPIKKDQKGKGLTAKFFGGRDDKKKQSHEVRDKIDQLDNQDQQDICDKQNEQDIHYLLDKQDQQSKLGIQNKQEQDKQYLRLQTQKDRQDRPNKKDLQNKYDEQNQQKNDEAQMSQKIKPKQELQSSSLSSFITQVKQSGNTLSSTLRSLHVQPESAKASASSNFPLYQIPIDRKKSQDVNKFTTLITSQQKQPLPKKQTHFLFYVSSIISAYMANQISKTVEQAREHLVLTIQVFLSEKYFQAIQFAKTIKVTQQHLINERQKFLPKRDQYINKKTLVFDLDETLIHCNESAQVPGDVYLPILFPTGELIEASINVRPYAQQILENLSKDFEIIIFTASHSCYANVVLDYLDPDKLWISHRLYRESCVQSVEGAYIKDLRVLADRNLNDLLLIDNAAYSFGLQLSNGIPIIPYYEDKQDLELLHLQDYLMQFKNVKDMRDFNSRSLKIDRFSEFNHPIDLLQKLFKEFIPQQ